MTEHRAKTNLDSSLRSKKIDLPNDTFNLTLDLLFIDKIYQPVEVILVDDPSALPIVDLTDLLIEFQCEV